MSIEENLRIDRIQNSHAAEGAKPSKTDPTEFRRLLETLEGIAKQADQNPVKDIDQLKDAVRSADDSFRQVMDMRKMLEAAYRKVLP